VVQARPGDVLLVAEGISKTYDGEKQLFGESQVVHPVDVLHLTLPYSSSSSSSSSMWVSCAMGTLLSAASAVSARVETPSQPAQVGLGPCREPSFAHNFYSPVLCWLAWCCCCAGNLTFTIT
jgi:hypothetical protein